MLSLVLLVFALVLFVVAGAIQPSDNPWKNRLVCFGLACWVGAEILTRTPLIGR